MTWAEHLISFYKNLEPPANLPEGIDWLYPQKIALVFETAEKFFHKFYDDAKPRSIFLGINPGRFGAGVTAVNFTGPRQLREDCGIEHSLKNGSELSAEFIYAMIKAYGGVNKFYSNFFIGSVSPLGFVKDGKNLNYYDDRKLQNAVEPFIIDNLNRLVKFQTNREICYCIGGEKNFKYLQHLNQQYQWFDKVVALPHPRFIMQYRRKEVEQYIRQYLQLISN